MENVTKNNKQTSSFDIILTSILIFISWILIIISTIAFFTSESYIPTSVYYITNTIYMLIYPYILYRLYILLSKNGLTYTSVPIFLLIAIMVIDLLFSTYSNLTFFLTDYFDYSNYSAVLIRTVGTGIRFIMSFLYILLGVFVVSNKKSRTIEGVLLLGIAYCILGVITFSSIITKTLIPGMGFLDIGDLSMFYGTIRVIEGLADIFPITTILYIFIKVKPIQQQKIYRD